MRLAHYSDIHVTHFPLSAGFALKRLAAVASYSLWGRGKDFEGSDARIAALLADIDAQQVDHALCTGDVTGVSGLAEFTRVEALYGARLTQPERHTVLPGNHDRYLAASLEERFFEQRFGALCGGAQFPLVKPLPGGVTLVALDTARPNSLIQSSGLVGAVQRERALGLLTDASLRDRFVVVAMHYGLLRSAGQRDTRFHGLEDDLEVMALLDRADVHVDLVLHGHMHGAYAVRTQRRQVLCVGSATDLHKPCGYHVLDLDPAARTVKVERREWSRATGAYEPQPSSPLARVYATRG